MQTGQRKPELRSLGKGNLPVLAQLFLPSGITIIRAVTSITQSAQYRHVRGRVIEH